MSGNEKARKMKNGKTRDNVMFSEKESRESNTTATGEYQHGKGCELPLKK